MTEGWIVWLSIFIIVDIKSSFTLLFTVVTEAGITTEMCSAASRV